MAEEEEEEEEDPMSRLLRRAFTRLSPDSESDLGSLRQEIAQRLLQLPYGESWPSSPPLEPRHRHTGKDHTNVH